MADLKKELGLVQGVGLLSTSLLGSGLFAVPALVSQQSGGVALWAWPVLILLFFPVALTFAYLGRRYPNAGGAAHFVELAFGPRLAQVTGWLFLLAIPFGLPVVLHIASGFWQAAFSIGQGGLLAIQIATIISIWLLGLKGAGSSANVQLAIAVLVIGLIAVIWYKGGISLMALPFSSIKAVTLPSMFTALAIMFWCFVGIEAFAHLASEFRHPERDFPRALLIGTVLAGIVYWACTVAVLHFNSFHFATPAAASLPNIIVRLFGKNALWVVCCIGYLACFASINIYTQSFARLVWSQARRHRPQSWLAQLSNHHSPANALAIIQLSCLMACLVVFFIQLSLDTLIVYANGIFIAVYLLCMLAGCRLLAGSAQKVAILGAGLSILMLIMIGWKCLLVVGAAICFWLLQPHLSALDKQP